MGMGGLTPQQQQQKAGLHDPLKDMEDELARINKLLSHGEVRPDIAGWTPSGPARPATNAQTPSRSGSPAPPPSPQQPGRTAQTFSLPDRMQPRLQNPVGSSS